MPLGKLHLLAAVCIPMAVMQVLTGCNLRWLSFSLAIECIYFLAHVHGVNGVCAAVGTL